MITIVGERAHITVPPRGVDGADRSARQGDGGEEIEQDQPDDPRPYQQVGREGISSDAG